MACHLVIAVRPFEEGKSRLAPMLDRDQRVSLNQTMLTHIFDVATQVFVADRIIVVSRSQVLLDATQAAGAHALAERGDGLNAALTAGAQAAVKRGATAILSLSSDLPYLQPADLRAMLDAPGDVVLATDQAGCGTNAMLLRRAFSIPYRYGADSLAAHRAEAEMAGLVMTIIDRPGLARDIDLPEDLAALRLSRPRFSPPKL